MNLTRINSILRIRNSNVKAKGAKGQSGIELLMLVSYSLIVFSAIYLVILQSNFSAIKEKRNMESMKISEWIGYEIDIATSIGDGYSKNFTLPDTIIGGTYSVIVTDNLVIVNSTETYTTKIITPNITGTIQSGDNYIENRDGLIYANL